MALALMPLAGAGLLVRSFVRVQQVDLGFNPKNLLTAFVMLPPSKYPEPRRQALFFHEVMDRIASLPGVECAGGADSAPMLTNDTGPVSIEGHPVEPEIQAERPKITPDYFRAMGIRLLRGLHLGGQRRLATGGHYQRVSGAAVLAGRRRHGEAGEARRR
jgi:hypothetical protein